MTQSAKLGLTVPAAPDDQERTIIPGPTASRGPGPVGPSRGNALPIGTRLEEFEVTGIVGEGGFGIVYLVRDHSLMREVAIKEYMPSALAARGAGLAVSVRSDDQAETFAAGLRSFVNEARLLAQFDHPSLLKVYRFWEANGTAYMAMPYYRGATLRQTLDALGRPPTQAWLQDLLRALLDALELMHHAHCYHRDIAPDNILVLDDGRPLLLDFGAARRVIGNKVQALTVILKPGYAPVEQYGEMPGVKQGPWTDVYALGAVLYAAISGRPPVPSVTRLVTDAMPPLRVVAPDGYAADFIAVIDRCLGVRPAERPQSIAELRALLHLGDRRQRDRGSGAKPTPPSAAPQTTAPGPGTVSADPTANAPTRARSGSGPSTRAAPALAPSGVAPLGRLAQATSGAAGPAAVATGPMASLPEAGSRAARHKKSPWVPALGLLLLLTFIVTASLMILRRPALDEPAAAVTVLPAAAPPPLAAAASAPTPSAEPGPAIATRAEPDAPDVIQPPMPAATEPAAAAPIEASASAAMPATAHRGPAPPTVKAATGSVAGRPVPRMKSSSPRCDEIIQRVSLGEFLTTDERIYLKQECGR